MKEPKAMTKTTTATLINDDSGIRPSALANSVNQKNRNEHDNEEGGQIKRNGMTR